MPRKHKLFINSSWVLLYTVPAAAAISLESNFKLILAGTISFSCWCICMYGKTIIIYEITNLPNNYIYLVFFLYYCLKRWHCPFCSVLCPSIFPPLPSCLVRAYFKMTTFSDSDNNICHFLISLETILWYKDVKEEINEAPSCCGYTIIVDGICQPVLPVSVLTGVRHHSPALRLCIVNMVLLVPAGH